MPEFDPTHELPRVLNRAHATSIVVGIIIGSGIFLVPHEMMAAVGSSRMVYAVWIVGGLLSLFGAMTYAEIAAGRPRYGGEYAFIREAYGDLAGFLYMWTWITIVKPASLATIAAGLARVLASFALFNFFDRPAFGPILWSQVFAIAVTWLITRAQHRQHPRVRQRPARPHLAQGSPDPRHSRLLLLRCRSHQRRLAQLRLLLHRCTRRLQRLHDRSHRRPLGL